MSLPRHREIQKAVASREAARIKASEGHLGSRFAVNGQASANSLMRGLRAVWNFAHERARRADLDMPAMVNPVGSLKLERAWFPSPRRETLVRADQLPSFYRAVCALPNRIGSDYIKLLLFTGLRRGEATALRWDDVDFAGRIIRLGAAQTKNGSKLDLPMTDFVRDLLVSRRSLGREGEYVFPGNGASGHLKEPKGFLDAVARASGVRASPHDLRRTFITVAADVAISPMALKALVNHSLGGDVTEGYARLSTEQLRRPAQMVCDRMAELSEIAKPEGGNIATMTATS
jgi:integrase